MVQIRYTVSINTLVCVVEYLVMLTVYRFCTNFMLPGNANAVAYLHQIVYPSNSNGVSYLQHFYVTWKC